MAYAPSAGHLAAAQTVEVNDGETITSLDLDFGAFMGQQFELGPSTTININEGGIIKWIGYSSSFTESLFDFEGSTLVINDGGVFQAEILGSSYFTNVDMHIQEGGYIGHNDITGNMRLSGSNTITVDGGIFNMSSPRFPSEASFTVLDGLVSRVQLDGGTGAVHGGSLYEGIRVYNNASIAVDGGWVDGLALTGPSSADLRGGTIRVSAIAEDASLDVLGGDFRINGVPTAEPLVTLGPNEVLSGSLDSGTPFFAANDWAQGAESGVIRLIQSGVAPADTTPMIVNDGVVPLSGLRAGQSLTVRDNAVLPANFFVVDSALTIDSGTAFDGINAVNADVVINGGEMDSYILRAPHSNGTIMTHNSHFADLWGQTSMAIHSGSWKRVGVHAGASLTLTDARLTSIAAEPGAQVTIQNGTLNSLQIDVEDVYSIDGLGVDAYIEVLGIDFKASGLSIGRPESVYESEMKIFYSDTQLDQTNLHNTQMSIRGSVVDLVDFVSVIQQDEFGYLSVSRDLMLDSDVLVDQGVLREDLRVHNARLRIRRGTFGSSTFTSGEGHIEYQARTVIIDGEQHQLVPGAKFDVPTDVVGTQVTLIDVDGAPFSFTITDSEIQQSSLFVQSSMSVVYPHAQGCAVDLTDDGQVDFFDVSAYLSLYANGAVMADRTRDGRLDFFDLTHFIGEIEDGCP